jgi:hypothetical protein
LGFGVLKRDTGKTGQCFTLAVEATNGSSSGTERRPESSQKQPVHDHSNETQQQPAEPVPEQLA